jgi:hypothetical protein
MTRPPEPDREPHLGDRIMGKNQLKNVSDTRGRTLELVEPLPPEALEYRNAPDHWSAGEILDHLVKADSTYLGEIRKLIRLKRVGKRPLIFVTLSRMEFSLPLIPRFLLPLGDIPVGFFNLFLPKALRELALRYPVIRAESPEILRPRRDRRKRDLIAELRGLPEDVERLFQENSDIDFTELRYYHPLFGFNNAYDILGLMVSHERRHQRQLRGLVAALPPSVRTPGPEVLAAGA